MLITRFRSKLGIPQVSSPSLSAITLVRCLHVMPTMPFKAEEGVKPLLSAKSVELLRTLHRSYLQRINSEVQGTELAALNLYQLAERTYKDSNQVLLHHYASQAWNMDFWLQGLTVHPREPIPALVQVVEREFTSWLRFQDIFSQSAASILASGWTWLVRRGDGRLSIINTYNGSSPIFSTPKSPTVKPESGSQSFSALLGLTRPAAEHPLESGPVTPIIGLNMWEHAWIPDYGLDKEAYISNFWKTVNWSRAAVIMNIC